MPRQRTPPVSLRAFERFKVDRNAIDEVACRHVDLSFPPPCSTALFGFLSTMDEISRLWNNVGAVRLRSTGTCAPFHAIGIPSQTSLKCLPTQLETQLRLSASMAAVRHHNKPSTLTFQPAAIRERSVGAGKWRTRSKSQLEKHAKYRAAKSSAFQWKPAHCTNS